MHSQGAFITIEGAHMPSSEQLARIATRLSQDGYDVEVLEFPQLQKPSGHFVSQYLTGAYGKPEAIGPYTGSLFYALDHYAARLRIKYALQEGRIVLATGFAGRTMALHGQLFDHPEERRGYFIWLDNVEYQMLGLPRPDTNIVLQTVTAQAPEDMKQLSTIYDELCRLFPKDFRQVDGLRNRKLMAPPQLDDLLVETIQPALPKPHKTTGSVHIDQASPRQAAPAPQKDKAPTVDMSDLLATTLAAHGNTHLQITKTEEEHFTYFVPLSFKPELARTFRRTLDEIIQRYHAMMGLLAASPDGTHEEAKTAVQRVLPVAILQTYRKTKDFDPVVLGHHLAEAQAVLGQLGSTTLDTKQPKSKIQVAAEHLPLQHSIDNTPVKLIDYWPKNELSILPDMLYEHTNLSLAEIRDTVQTWPYEQKLQAYTGYLDTDPEGSALSKTHYSWDILSSYQTLREVAAQGTFGTLSIQPLSPRQGYKMPKAIEDAGLGDLFEQCFDLSFELYSTIQKAGHWQDAQYAVLQGHRVRWQADCNAKQLLAYLQSPDTNKTFKDLVLQKLHEAHPLLAEAAG